MAAMNRMSMAQQLNEQIDGESILDGILGEVANSKSAFSGVGADVAAASLSKSKRATDESRAKGLVARKNASAAVEDAFTDPNASDTRDLFSLMKADETNNKAELDADREARIIKANAAINASKNRVVSEQDRTFINTGKIGPRGAVLDVPYVESGIRDDAPITYSGDQAAGASGRTAAIDAALREALGEDEEEGTLSPDDMPITRANTDFPSRIGMDNTRGLMSKTEEAITEEAITEEAITEEATPDLIDFAFIMEQEGFEQDIYVPRDEDGVTALDKSGPTIASGFDLGQRNLADLAGLPPALISKLEPYLGLKKQAAIDFIKANPLNITEEEASIINTFAKDQETGKLIKLWNKTSKTPWEDLTSEQATVVASVAFQFGNLSTEAPKFWGHVTKGNWDKAIGELRNFGGPTPSRRIREADYLESGTA